MRIRPLVTAAALLIALAGCASSGGATPAPTVTETTTVTASPTSTPTPTRTPVADGTCTVDQLTLTNQHDGEASGMSQYYFDIVFTNTSSTECTLEGYPGVSFVGDGNGTQIGDPAGEDPSVAVTTVTLAAGGGTAVSHVHGTQPGAYDCTETQADGIRVYPPHSYESAYVADPLPACATAGVVLLQVTPVEAG
ncbi:DUF4232 domain-containing protein [Microbacteriaceae bacterium VKM Ac-2855]|nr:DUF4232 domain-containing protein [Microbacteriaceae bacterium VKM Ac-2855]